jgi:DNA-binding phage protein
MSNELVLDRDAVLERAHQQGNSIKSLAEEAGLHPQTLYKSLRHEASPSLSTLGKLCQVLDVEPASLIHFKETEHGLLR